MPRTCKWHEALKPLRQFCEWKWLRDRVPVTLKIATPATILVTGISGSGTSYLCSLIECFSNCVALNETPELLQALVTRRIPRCLSTYLRDVRAAVHEGRPIRNKVLNGRIIQDTAKRDELTYYVPEVDDTDFVLVAKKTYVFLSSLDRLREALPDAAHVICVRNPLDTIASWKQSFKHLRQADLLKRRVGHPRDPWLPTAAQQELTEIDAIDDLAVRRARLWTHLAKRALADRNHILLRYEDLLANPLEQLDRILAGFPRGVLREPITPGKKSDRRDLLEAPDYQAIAAICAGAAEALGFGADLEQP